MSLVQGRFEDLPPEIWHNICYLPESPMDAYDVINVAVTCESIYKKVLGDDYSRSKWRSKLGMVACIEYQDMLAYTTARSSGNEQIGKEVMEALSNACLKSEMFLQEAIRLRVKLSPRLVGEQVWHGALLGDRIVERHVEFLEYGENLTQRDDGKWILNVSYIALSTLSIQVHPQPSSLNITMRGHDVGEFTPTPGVGFTFASACTQWCNGGRHRLTVEKQRPESIIDNPTPMMDLLHDYAHGFLRNVHCCDQYGNYHPVLSARGGLGGMIFEFVFDEYPSDLIVIQQRFLAGQLTHLDHPDQHLDRISTAPYARGYDNGIVFGRRECLTDDVVSHMIRPSLVDVLDFYKSFKV